jgi:trehalose 6-phosphate phosphatase
MNYILSRASRSILVQLAAAESICAFDFDGTLAPIAETPDEAAMRAPTRRLLCQVAAAYPCMVLSGRARADVLSKLDGACVSKVIGNHGAETEFSDPTSLALVAKWKSAIAPEIASFPGVWIEDKGLSLAVHYRQSPVKAPVRQRVLAAAKNLERARVFGGKQVINVALSGTPNKGQALASELNHLNCNWALFVGDDENDESAFALEGNVVAIRVGRSRTSKARYYLRSQREIDELLKVLISLRERR